MEEHKKPMLFTQVNKEADSTPSKQVAPSERKMKPPSLDNPNYVNIQLKHGVVLTATKDEEEDYSKIETLQDIIALDKRKPNNIVKCLPPLFAEFIHKGTGTINTGVSIGDSVICKKKFMDNKGHIPRIVTDLYLKALNNMTIIVAVLEDGDFYISNRLEKVK